MRHPIVALVAAWLVTLSGCGQGTAIPATTPTASLPAVPVTVPGSPGPEKPVTILGVVRAGALPGCNVLLAEDGRHYLLLDTTDPPRNVPVAVTGVLDTSLVSYCNSGQPLHVQRITPW